MQIGEIMGKSNGNPPKQLSVASVANADLENLEYAIKTLERVDNWIINCDNKISVATGFFLGLLALSVATDYLGKFVDFIREIIANASNIYSIIFLVLIVLDASAYLVSIFFLLEAMTARLNIKSKEKRLNSENSNIYFGNISKLKYKEYKDSFIQEKNRDRLNDVISQIYINSVIAEVKYKYCNRGVVLFAFALALSAVSFVYGVIVF